jgi:uncharacterized protein (TIGR02145 family)
MSISTFRTLAFVAFAVITAPLFSQGTCEIEGLFGPPPFEVCGDDLRHDGYDYATVQIGTQCWFQENLRSDHYSNGDAIPGNLDDATWTSTTAGAQDYYDNEAVNLSAYGRLYNWYAVDDARGLCPSGWHVPSDDEWKTMEMHLGMSASDANSTGSRSSGSVGEKLKEAGTAHWLSPNTGNNSSGFTGLGNGAQNTSGVSVNLSKFGYFWTSSPNGGDAWYRVLKFDSSIVARYDTNPGSGYAVRCELD